MYGKRRYGKGLDMSKNGPGKSHRKGITLVELIHRFPTEEAAREWFEGILWPEERCCGHCGSVRTSAVKNEKPMPYRCKDCRKYFSVKTGTALACSKVSLQKWAIAVYLCLTNLKSVSSMKLHRDLGVTQKTAWFMMQRIREAFTAHGSRFSGPVEVDEAYFGGLRKNMSNAKRAELKEQGLGRGPKGKTAVVAVKDRETKQVAARVVERTDGATLGGFVNQHTSPDAKLYTDDTSAYRGTARERETVKHSAQEYVRYLEGETVHTNGVESFWSMLKRAHKGTFHRLSAKHLQRYVSEFAGRHNLRDKDTIDQMQNVVAGLIGRRLLYRDLIADNGLSAAAG